MSFKNKLAQRREWKKGVKHCTFDPMGPGVVRIHLIPPKFSLFGNPSHIVILNGYYLLPLGYSWAVMLSHFMDEVNAFDGKEITPADEERIFAQTIAKTKKVYPSADKAVLEDDLEEMLNSNDIEIPADAKERLGKVNEYWRDRGRTNSERRSRYYTDDRIWPFIKQGILCPGIFRYSDPHS